MSEYWWWIAQAIGAFIFMIGFGYVAWRSHSPWPRLLYLGLALIALGNVTTSYATAIEDGNLRNAGGSFVRGILFVLLVVTMRYGLRYRGPHG